MRRTALAVVLLASINLGMVACGDDGTSEPPAADPRVYETDIPTAEDIFPITKSHDGVDYLCFYLYVDGFKSGGPALWCERSTAS